MESVEGDLPFTRRHVSVGEMASLRQLVTAVAVRVGLARDRADRLVLGVNEAVSNAILYGGGSADVVIDHDVEEDRLVVRVQDTGPGIAGPLLAAGLPPSDALHGRGLHLMRLLCDHVEVLTGSAGTVVTLCMAVHHG